MDYKTTNIYATVFINGFMYLTSLKIWTQIFKKRVLTFLFRMILHLRFVWQCTFLSAIIPTFNEQFLKLDMLC